MTYLQAIELAFAIFAIKESLSTIGVPTKPIRAGNAWFVVKQVEPPDSAYTHNPG